MGVITFLMLAFFPSMQTESMKELTGAKLEGISKELLAALGISEMMDFTMITNYFGYVLQYMTLALLIYGTQLAVTSLVKEETEGTIEFLYSKPVSRSEIFVWKVLANLVCFLAVLLILAIVTVIGYVTFGEYALGESIREVSLLYGGILFVGIVFLSSGTLLSSLIKSSKGASGVSTGIVFITFILGIAGVLNDRLHFLTYLSPMDWIKTRKLVSDGILPEEWLIGIGVIVIGLAAAHQIYRRRDLHT